MIPLKAERFDVESTLVGKKKKLGISVEAMGHIMDVLTNLYGDPIEAAVREYTINARDSHIENGTPDVPIKVYTPNAMTPVFIVEDTGVGMSVDFLLDVYTEYGISTKRETNDQTGEKGLGSKSALAISQQFTVEAVQNGVKVLGIISRTEEGDAEIQIVDTSATDQPNGVRITIPMAPSQAFNDRVDKFFQWWEPGTVLVNDEEPEYALSEYDVLYDNVYYKKDSWCSHTLVMGGIAYPVVLPPDINQNLAQFQIKTVVVAPIGAVATTPARESLNLENKETKDFLDKAYRGSYEAMIKTVQDKIDLCETPYDAWVMAKPWYRQLTNATFTYKGKDIPTNIEQSHILIWSTKDSARSNDYNHIQNTLQHSDDLVLITGCESPSPYATGRINGWRKDNQKVSRLYKPATLLVGEISEWLNGAELHDYAIIKKSFTPDYSTTRKTYYESQSSSDSYRRSMELSVVKGYSTVIYSVTHYGPGYDSYTFPPDDKTVIVQITERRKAKFLREVPHAISSQEFYEQERDRLAASLTQAEIDWVNDPYYTPATGVEAENYDDPAIKRWISQSKMTPSESLKKYKSVLTKLGQIPTGKETPIKKYPLSDAYAMRTEHAIWYMNTYYNQVLKHKT